eukprot:5923626-Amphidinium_carterae.1
MGLFYLHMQLEAQHQQQEVEQQVVVRGLRGTEFDEQPQHAEVVEVKEPWELVHWEDNSNPPPRDPMEEEVQSEAPDVLPGASELHLHGKLGLRPDGTSRIVPMPLPPGGLTEDDLHESHRGFCFNSRASEAADVDRSQPEVRSSGCRARHPHYPKKLPQASV